MTLAELQLTLVYSLSVSSDSIGLSLPNGGVLYKYLTPIYGTEVWLSNTDMNGDLLADDTYTVVVRYFGAVYNDTGTISTADDDTLTTQIEALIVAP